MRAGRLIGALGVALLCAPGTFVRTPMAEEMPHPTGPERIAGPAPTGDPAWQVAGVWRYAADHRYFGGFSALLPLDGERLQAFSDRGARFTFVEPDSRVRGAGGRPAGRSPVVLQPVEKGFEEDLKDIESAARDPATGTYWLGFEGLHAVHRYTAADEPDGLRVLEDEVDWPANSGAEAMLRLPDGRFMVLPEGEEEGLLFPSDPVAGGVPEAFAFRPPVEGYAPTDLARLPDGRLLLLMRRTVFALPPFETLLAIGPPPRAGGTWAPQVALRLDPVIPSDNYEGLAIRPLADGKAAVWIVADDNLSVMQRTLLAKLVFDPAAEAE
ncbi:esterase-like activity of phytase family protein [Erythrobacter sp. HL-111]|uniref:esterase-like activity of phytase family protein n=1 Tax=Erythrobacter sp. HL-111 TaxID=1798193 RepID=UPI0006DB017E|nr:esterase-like activity of phytase family protein [Erythrobacter sp. HL-111]KPP85838.1 MAG: hypothetical protein HLUCCO15_13280 [Erythrobacteraceae bacterium HL-111]SDS78902.1 hypothetical protein SAMN04515621_2235 [Erythrobacter sp. HL-111]